MKQDLPSYIANDAAPLFPDLSAMSHEEFINYEAPPERLAFYRLHTEEGLKAFLHDVYWIGYPGLFIATKHVWSLLIEPRAYHCTLMGQMSGAGGAGKRALVNTLKQWVTTGRAGQVLVSLSAERFSRVASHSEAVFPVNFPVRREFGEST